MGDNSPTRIMRVGRAIPMAAACEAGRARLPDSRGTERDWFDPGLTITLVPDPLWTAEAEAAARAWLALLEHLDDQAGHVRS